LDVPTKANFLITVTMVASLAKRSDVVKSSVAFHPHMGTLLSWAVTIHCHAVGLLADEHLGLCFPRRFFSDVEAGTHDIGHAAVFRGRILTHSGLTTRTFIDNVASLITKHACHCVSDGSSAQ
jgi:hypothetical protein